MAYIAKGLGSLVGKLSDDNYVQSLALYRLWSDIVQTHHQIPSDKILDMIWDNRGTTSIDPTRGKLTYPTAYLIVRFMSDAESDHILYPRTSGLQNRLYTRSLQDFFNSNMEAVCDNESRHSGTASRLYTSANFIAHWVNLGYVDEAVICNHILQSLSSHPKLYDHQADALIILLKLAGATFEAYTDPSVVHRCFELLEGHYSRGSVEWGLVQVRAVRAVKGSNMAKPNFKEIVALRERGWEGLPPPPVFMTGKSRSTGASQKDPAATPVVASLGLPNKDLEHQIPQPPPLESVIAPESEATPTSPVTPVIQSPSVSIATLSDFTIADTSDDESPIDPAITDTSDDEPSPVDPTVITPHATFYLEDGNVEVLCGNTLFRVHTSVLSFHSPVLGRMFAKSNLATAESPNGCPRISSSDAAADFITLLKIVYLPAYVTLLNANELLC